MFRFLSRLFNKKISSVDEILKYSEGKRYYRDAHTIRRNNLDPDVLKVVHRLQKFNHKAYLVGGVVRDILLGRRPKDYDVATSATPNQVRKTFNNCRIIGRRFKIVHVVFRNKIVEVSTFRSLPDHRFQEHQKDGDYLMTRDNAFGSAKEDAARRDFTINALYYDPRNESIIDFVGGLEDIEKKVIRVIGDPDISFREDPARMLRAVKFSILLGFEIEKKTKLAIKRWKNEILKTAPARLLEEYNKIFRTWKSAPLFQGLAENHLLEVLFKDVVSPLQKKDEDWAENFLSTDLGRKLAQADKMASEREEISPTIYMALIFHGLVDDLNSRDKGSMAHNIKTRLEPVFEAVGVPKRERDKILKIYISQHRFLSTQDEKSGQNEFFQKKDFFYDAFMFFKIISVVNNHEKAIQSALFWEIAAGRNKEYRDEVFRKKQEHRFNRPPRNHQNQPQEGNGNHKRNNHGGGKRRGHNEHHNRRNQKPQNNEEVSGSQDAPPKWVNPEEEGK
jgi:poly(A) polymerase